MPEPSACANAVNNAPISGVPKRLELSINREVRNAVSAAAALQSRADSAAVQHRAQQEAYGRKLQHRLKVARREQLGSERVAIAANANHLMRLRLGTDANTNTDAPP